MLNEKIRHQGFSAKEILFSRDQFTMENLKINDEKLAEEKMDIRKRENIYSSKSRADTPYLACSANTKRGNLVFLKKDGSKLERRDLYLVTGVIKDEGSVTVCKLPSALSGNSPVKFQPHNVTYKVKQTEMKNVLCEKLEAQNCRLENEVVELKAALEKQINDQCKGA